MIDRVERGELPDVPHTVFRGRDGELLYEHCLTRHAFDAPYSILHHLATPHAFAEPEGAPVPVVRVPNFARDVHDLAGLAAMHPHLFGSAGLAQSS